MDGVTQITRGKMNYNRPKDKNSVGAFDQVMAQYLKENPDIGLDELLYGWTSFLAFNFIQYPEMAERFAKYLGDWADHYTRTGLTEET